MKILNLNIAKDISKYLRELPFKNFRQVCLSMFELRENPLPYDAEKLKGYDNLYRRDMGEYRIIYSFDKTTVYIYLIGKRNDDEVYRRLKQRFKH
ncbi:MAG: hypothetical protein BWK78_04425 [Thiotrichaceae bacterium IS1]|jgi:mRNA interferase RelE/StbE|nr:MAG: hypothetical protein BWK78_04425 [Thiotrichaceae bacterium IS1]